MKSITAIALMVTSLSTFANNFKCISETTSQISSIEAVSLYHSRLLTTIQSEDLTEAEKANTAFNKLGDIIDGIAMEVCQAADKKQ